MLFLQAGQSLLIGAFLLVYRTTHDGILLMDEGDPLLQEGVTEEYKSKFFDFASERQSVLEIKFVLIDYIHALDVAQVDLLLDVLLPADQGVLAVDHLGVSQHRLLGSLTNNQDAFNVHDFLVLLHVGGEDGESMEVKLHQLPGVADILCLV